MQCETMHITCIELMPFAEVITVYTDQSQQLRIKVSSVNEIIH